MMNIDRFPNKEGFFGSYGGQFISEDLKSEFNSIAEKFIEFKNSPEFINEFNYLLKHYVGRPTPVYYAKNLSSPRS